jgi:membrane-bound ClpP family serine protease
MGAATEDLGRRSGWLAILAAALVGLGAPARAEQPGADEGVFITVQKPITSAVVDHIKAKTERALQRKVRTIVYDFNPAKHATGTEEYGPCRDLAAYLGRLQVTTVAFVHGVTTGHRVLPVLACKDLVMSSEARLGNVIGDSTDPLDEDQRQFYRQLAEQRVGRAQAALVLKMFDKNLEVIKATTLQGSEYFLDRAAPPPPEVRLTGREPVVPGLGKNEIGFYPARQARNELHLCKLIRETREEVKDAYDLKPASLREDPLEGRDPKAVRVLLNEHISRAVAEALMRRIRQTVGDHANFVILQLECGGGDPLVALDLAEFLRSLSDEDEQGRFPVTTIAYIPKNAPDAATVIALGCTEIVMGRDAHIGDFEQITKPQGGDPNPDRYKMLRDALMELAAKQGYAPLLARGMLDANVWIYEVRSQKGRAERKLLTREELEADRAGPREWGSPRLIKPGEPNGKFLVLIGQEAKDLDLAREVVDDFSHLTRLYHLENVRDAKLDFLYKFAAFLQQPAVSVFLIMIGIACLILELKMPGLGLPGVIAALCFVLYFWAQSHQLSGQIIMLAVLLFVLGLLLLGLEVFVLPGFGVPGISGIVLIVVSLALATLEKKPETTQEWVSFGRAMGAVGLSLAGAVTVAFLLARYLPNIPVANRLVLKPPVGEDNLLEGDALPASSDGVRSELAALLGAIGVAATTLRPAGIARFGDDFVDVITDGSYVQAGTRVQVIEIEGNRVIVKEV